MAKELYLYSPIYDFVAESVISQINENMGSDLTLRVNSPGGDVKSGYGIAAKMREHGNVNIKVDGSADSMAADLLLFANNVEALDVSTFVLHRAAYSEWYTPTPEDLAYLEKINKDLRSKLEAKIDAEKFKEVTGYTIDQMFDPNQRINIVLDAKQAKSIGLINKINKLTPAEVEAFNKKMAVAAINENLNTNIKMTAEEIKAKYPEAYKAIIADGVNKERERVGAWAVFASVDPEAVTAAIKDGKEMNMTIMAEMVMKKTSPETLKKIEGEGAPAVQTKETEKPKAEEEKKVEAFESEVKTILGIKK